MVKATTYWPNTPQNKLIWRRSRLTLASHNSSLHSFVVIPVANFGNFNAS